MVPHFLGVGAQRAGTTWLHQCLAEHPDVFMPKVKESHFFSWKFDQGLAWYESLFSEARSDQRIGEITPNYLNIEGTAERIASTLPDVKLIVILREPASRAFSAYSLLAREKYRGLSFAEALESDSYLIGLGMYSQMIEAFFRHFRREQFLFLKYDDVQDQPAQLLDAVWRHIGVEPGFRPSAMRTRYNRIVYPGLQDRLAAWGMRPLVEWVKRTPIGDLIRNAHARKRAPAGDTAAMQRLKGEFRDDIGRVASQTGLDLSPWLA